jgi:hypothetical protein
MTILVAVVLEEFGAGLTQGQFNMAVLCSFEHISKVAPTETRPPAGID